MAPFIDEILGEDMALAPTILSAPTQTIWDQIQQEFDSEENRTLLEYFPEPTELIPAQKGLMDVSPPNWDYSHIDGDVLVLGAGNGRELLGNIFVNHRNPLSRQYIAIDLPKVASAYKKAISEFVLSTFPQFQSRFCYLGMDITHFSYRPMKYAVISALNVLTFLEPKKCEELLPKLHTSLVDGGILFTSVNIYKGSTTDRCIWSFKTEQVALEVFTGLGFSVLKVDKVDSPSSFYSIFLALQKSPNADTSCCN